jgi:hypothetical protein
LVKIAQSENGEYYAWKEIGKIPHFIFPSLARVEICFPYGTRCLIEQGIGSIIRLEVKELINEK